MTATPFEALRPAGYLTRLAASDVGRDAKARALALLDVRPGLRVVDLGCGPGADLRAAADAVGPDGAVVGLDHDPDAVTAAARLVADRPNVTVRVADAHHLDLAPASVDRLRTDRVLQHVADPARVLHEVTRVLRPGGLAVFAEPDWDTLVVDHPEAGLADAYRRCVVTEVVRHARVGRTLHRLAHDAGLRGTAVVPVTAVYTDAVAADRVLGFRRVTARAVAAGYLDDDAARRWLDHLATAPFLAAVTLFLTRCERPARS